MNCSPELQVAGLSWSQIRRMHRKHMMSCLKAALTFKLHKPDKVVSATISRAADLEIFRYDLHKEPVARCLYDVVPDTVT